MQPLQRLTGDILKIVSLYGVGIPASLLEYSVPVGEILQNRENFTKEGRGVTRTINMWRSRDYYIMGYYMNWLIP